MKLSLSRNPGRSQEDASEAGRALAVSGQQGRVSLAVISSPNSGADSKSSHILAFATQGVGGGDELRIRGLLENFAAVDFYPFDRTRKVHSFWELLRKIRKRRFDLVLMEGTGVAGGFALIMAQLLNSTRYVVSSGDAVGPFIALHWRSLGPIATLYERVLYLRSAGFIGWTPYLTGRALTLGCPRGMTAPGWAPFRRASKFLPTTRARIRAQLQIPQDSIVFGIVGSLAWSNAAGYCYGYELVKAVARAQRDDIRVLIVGDGDGRPRLERLAADSAQGKTIFTGWVPRDILPEYLEAMDVASLPQSVDRVGCFRYSTKLSEYVAMGLPVVTGQVPLAYDLDEDGDWLWRLSGEAPWDERYIEELSQLMKRLSGTELVSKRSAVPQSIAEFDRTRQVARVTAFLKDVIDA
jgi:glycosyltransferase involved in cell wall biosynthesis